MSSWSFPRWPSFQRQRGRKRRAQAIESPRAAESPQPADSNPEEAHVDAQILVPETQTVLLLRQPKTRYELTGNYPTPQLKGDNEVLVRTRAIGLNPIDWKAPDFNFGLPATFPCISGRECAGEVVKISGVPSRFRVGDKVMVISTDYRDSRKATFQEYVAAFDHNVIRLPKTMSFEDGSTIGVAFVAAVLLLGICMGVDFSNVLGGPDLLKIVREIDPELLPEDVRKESLDGIRSHERAKRGDWVAIWGGSSTSANIAIQLAKLTGLKVAVVVDKAKHGLRLSNHQVLRPDLLVDSHDPQRAVDIIRANLGNSLRFGVDTRGKDTATWLLQALSPSNLETKPIDGGPPSPPPTPHDSTLLPSHLIGLAGLPKQTPPEGNVFHAVPIKLFHEVPAVGKSLATWLERLLQEGQLFPPEIIDIESGLASINQGLDRMRKGEISGGKLIVRTE